MRKMLAVLTLALIGCSADAPLSPHSMPTTARLALDPYFDQFKPAAPSDVSAAVVGADSIASVLRVTFTDNADNDFNTCATFTGSGNQTACSYDGAAYLGERSFDVRIPAGTYQMTLQATAWVQLNDPVAGSYHVAVPSDLSAPIAVVVDEPVTITTTTKRKGRK
jgi:hypothetical protein